MDKGSWDFTTTVSPGHSSPVFARANSLALLYFGASAVASEACLRASATNWSRGSRRLS